MTISEFERYITTWDELLEFCNDNGLYTCEDIASESIYEEWVEEDIANRECSWYALADYMQELPRYGEYFVRNSWLDYEVLNDSDFESYKQGVYEEALNDDIFDDDDDSNDEKCDVNPSDDDEWEAVDFAQSVLLVAV